MDEPLMKAEHLEFAKRMEADHERFASRIKELEKKSASNSELLVTIERLAANMENMQREMRQQNERLARLEGQDGEMWRKVTGYIITAVIGIVVGYIFTHIGM